MVDNAQVPANNASVAVIKRAAQFYDGKSEGYAYDEVVQLEVGGVLYWFASQEIDDGNDLGWYVVIIQSVMCKGGSYADANTTSCEVCATPSYSSGGNASTSCDLCTAYYYREKGNCVKCMDEADCSNPGETRPFIASCHDDTHPSRSPPFINLTFPSMTPRLPGTTIEALKILPGYWRTNTASDDLKECLYEDACEGGASSQCATGYEGPLCALCEPGYFSTTMNQCLVCEMNSDSAGYVGLGSLVLTTLLLTVCFMACRKSAFCDKVFQRCTDCSSKFKEKFQGRIKVRPHCYLSKKITVL